MALAIECRHLLAEAVYCHVSVRQAMRQAGNQEMTAKIAEKDPFGPIDELIDKRAAAESVNATAMAQVTT